MATIEPQTLQAKSDQMNAVDLTKETTFRIEKVDYNPTSDQPIRVHFEGQKGRPWKPSKGMLRLLCKAWTMETDNWHGNLVTLYNDPSVKWAGKPVGGLRVIALSGIGNKPMEYCHVISKQKRVIETVQPLKNEQRVVNEFIFNHWEERISSVESEAGLNDVIKELKGSGYSKPDVSSLASCVESKKLELSIEVN